MNSNFSEKCECFCPFCFRLYFNDDKFWIQHPDDILKIISSGQYWKKPIYQNIMEGICFQLLTKSSTISMCMDCSAFIRKNVLSKSDENVWKRKPDCIKHPTHVLIEYILSGTCSTKPCSSVVIHGIHSLCHKFPQNPILMMEDRSLYNIIGSIISFQKLFNIHSNDIANHLVLMKWIWCGCPPNIGDMKFAKKIRKYAGNNPGIYTWTKSTFPSACRFCCEQSEIMTTNESKNYRSVLMKREKDTMTILRETVESCKTPMDYISFLCPKCSEISTISHEFQIFLHRFFNLDMKDVDNREFYYQTKIILFEKK